MSVEEFCSPRGAKTSSTQSHERAAGAKKTVTLQLSLRETLSKGLRLCTEANLSCTIWSISIAHITQRTNILDILKFPG
jgi:hypothetical protein